MGSRIESNIDMPLITAVSVATPRIIDIHGRPTNTSIVREAHQGPLLFGFGGPIGNRTAVHTEDVLATVTENYDFWAEQLGIPRQTWPASFWGENITISGLSENTLRVGDRLRVGASAVFEVTSPRIPCFKLSWRLNQPESFLHTLVESGLTGFYLRVIKPGEVAAGDLVEWESPYANNIIVGDLSRLLQSDSVDVELLKKTLATPGLGRQATSMLHHRITQLTDGARCRLGRWQGWRRFEVHQIVSETTEVRSFILRPQDGGGAC